MAIELQETTNKKSYFFYIIVVLILALVLYFLFWISAAFRGGADKSATSTVSQIMSEFAEIPKEGATMVLEVPILKMLVKHNRFVLDKSQLGRNNPFVLSATGTFITSTPPLSAPGH